MRSFELRITPADAGQTIKDIFRRKFGFSAHMISRLKVCGGVRLNGEQARVTRVVAPGDVLCAVLPEEKAWIAPSDTPVEVAYEDEDVLIVNKPAAMAVHPSPGNQENTLANALMGHWQRRGETHIFRAVNRLDKGTSGLMAVAKNPHAHHVLSRQLQEGELQRQYLAICCGVFDHVEGTVDLPIARVPGSTIKRQVDEGGKFAVTHFRVEEQRNGYALVRLALKTGRTHQIRVHMSAIGHPLVGDWLYGERLEALERPALHSCEICFYHPVSGEEIIIRSALSADLQEFIDGREAQ